MINSRKLEDLHPDVASKARVFIAECRKAGLDVLITSTLRDNEYQAKLYAQGRTTPGKVITKAMPGSSFHNYGLAFDFVPMVKGAPVWDNDLLWLKCGTIAQSAGLEWGGAWTGFKDKPHCQAAGGLTIAQLKGGARLA